jgi:hypothetical protein
MDMVGRVKFTSGKTCPPPITRPAPQWTGRGAAPKPRAFAESKARVVKRRGERDRGMLFLLSNVLV